MLAERQSTQGDINRRTEIGIYLNKDKLCNYSKLIAQNKILRYFIIYKFFISIFDDFDNAAGRDARHTGCQPQRLTADFTCILRLSNILTFKLSNFL